jgi:hypothetical protein
MPTTSVLEQARQSVVGALHLVEDGAGFTPVRLPARSLAQASVDATLALIVQMPAGVRLRFRTDSPWLDLTCQLTMIQIDETVYPAVFDVLRDGELVTSAVSTAGTVISANSQTRELEVRAGGPTTERFDLSGDGVVEVWLPHIAVVQVQDVRIADGCVLEPVSDDRPVWIHHGSSISHCAEAERPTETWPALAAQQLGLNLVDLGFAGQCMLDQFSARAIRDTPASFISLKLGINVVNGDTMRDRTFFSAVHGFLDTIRDGHPTTPITVITPIVCPVAEEAPGPTRIGPDGQLVVPPRPEELAEGALTMTKVRAHLEAVVAQRADPQLRLLSGLDLLGPADTALLHDGLHPSAEGYRVMAHRFVTLTG